MRTIPWLRLPDYVGREMPLGPKERVIVSEKAWRMALKDWRGAIIYVVVAALMMGSYIGLGEFCWALGWTRFWQVAALLVVNSIFWWFALLWVLRRRLVRLARRVLREYGVEACVACGYWLRDLEKDANRCPECGLQRQAPSVQGPWP